MRFKLKTLFLITFLISLWFSLFKGCLYLAKVQTSPILFDEILMLHVFVFPTEVILGILIFQKMWIKK